MAYELLLMLLEDYNVNLLSTKIYWEKPKEKEEYQKFWDAYQEIEKTKSSVEQKVSNKQILYLKNDIKKIEGTGLQSKHIIQFYKKKLVELGAMKHLKNTYSKTTNVKLTGKNHKMFKETEKTA